MIEQLKVERIVRLVERIEVEQIIELVELVVERSTFRLQCIQLSLEYDPRVRIQQSSLGSLEEYIQFGTPPRSNQCRTSHEERSP